ncbi:RNA polymerase primary sigma factor [Filimonas lacunae]|uniref:RNA polymerase primary sigma factor n=1 Tax=Filimonas lacunae TaxID=477680 RepID=A0A173MS78_9BACT|nr:RNA polymerase sigma factor RpoD [Filimonas lacunae]SIT17344.1 RNA polymerase primary sigma factor [Filimonas lacunae]
MSMRQLKITKSITNRESQSLEKYLQEIGKVGMVTIEDEVKLAAEIKKGNQLSLEKLVKANLRFVVSVAKQYQNQGLSLPDLINEGNLGLIKAAIRFDETKGFKFISYAVWWIRQSIMQSLAEQSRLVRLPLNKVGLNNRITKACQQLEQEFEREPTPEEVSDLLEISLEEVAASMNINSRHVSMDSPMSDAEDAITLMDVMVNANADSTDRQLDHYESLRQDIARSLLSLTGRQKDVVCYFFGIGVDHPLSLEDIGERFNLTRERVRQIKDKAISKLKTKTCSHLRVYLG